MICPLCKKKVDFRLRAVIDGDGYVWHSACYAAYDLGEEIIDLDNNVKITSEGEVIPLKKRRASPKRR